MTFAALISPPPQSKVTLLYGCDSVPAEGVGLLHFMNNEKNDVNNAVLFAARQLEAGGGRTGA